MKKNKGLNINMVTVEFMEKFKRDMLDKMDIYFDKMNEISSNQSQPTPHQRWIKSKKVMQILAISPGTLQQMRINGQLPFTKVGGVIFYDVNDIHKMLELRKQNAQHAT